MNEVKIITLNIFLTIKFTPLFSVNEQVPIMTFLVKEVIAVSLDVRVNDRHQLATTGCQVGSHFQRMREFMGIPGEIPEKKTQKFN